MDKTERANRDIPADSLFGGKVFPEDVSFGLVDRCPSSLSGIFERLRNTTSFPARQAR